MPALTEDFTKLPVMGDCSPPAIPLPLGAWDCHAHVFGPFDRYPPLAKRRYDPPLATGAQYVAMLDTVGFDRGVLVHASCYGYDNACTAAGVATAPERAHGVCVVDPDIADAELEAMHRAGFRAIRFTVRGQRVRDHAGSLDFADLARLAPRMRALGWQAHVWANCDETIAAADFLTGCGLPIVFDHMGYFDTALGTGDPIFRSYLDLLGAGDFWVKMTPIRLAKGDPTYAAVRPFHDAVLARAPNRALFGSDWPYLSMDADRPDTGRLVDLFDRWTPDADLRRRILVDNPATLFGSSVSL